MCDLLAERERMLEQHPELAPPESPSLSRRKSGERRTESLSSSVDDAELADLLVTVAKQKIDNLWTTIQSKLVVEKPLLRISKEASGVVFWGCILVFGNTDRQLLDSF